MATCHCISQGSFMNSECAHNHCRPSGHSSGCRLGGRHAGAERRDQSQAGFSLVELMVTLLVTVIGLTGLMSLHAAMIKGNRDAVRSTEAMNLAQEALEELRATPIVDPDPASVGVPVTIQDTFGTMPLVDVTFDKVVTPKGVTYWLKFSLEPISGNLVRLRMSVEWIDSGDDPDGASVAPEDIHRMTLELIRTTLETL